MANEAVAMEDPCYRESQRYENFDQESCCTRLCLRPNPSVARYVYALIFLVTSLLAWTIRDYGHAVLSELGRLKGCDGARYCLGAEGVLRVSFGCSVSFLFISAGALFPCFRCCAFLIPRTPQLFFFALFVTTVGTKRLNDPRNAWNSEWWGAKMILWMGLMAVPFFLPSEVFRVYGKMAHVGAGIFLLIQLISVISFINWLNDRCNSEKNAERCHIQVTLISIAAYIVSIVGCIMMYVWYAPWTSCKQNILFITLTILLLQLITFVSMHPKVKVGYMPPGLMGSYLVFLCWCAIRSEPQSEICNKKAEVGSGSDWFTISSFVIAILVLVIATFSTGIDSKCLQFKRTAVICEGEVPYGYGFFHFVFAVGSMYFGMLFIGWDVHKTMQKWTIDVGWASTWVRVVNQWLAAVIYIWMQIAPLVWKRGVDSTTSFQEIL
ncbi:hypothetical protein HPP92_008506 [Vanilla planifolia]|uniref:Serine incorporator n=1 Tax=Vanilla planifolia TaxID=51239 RepID=A0A835R648_VANPL|nr:hypothetical protein HPP92_008506 [Vanilla planifolia]